MLDLLKVVAGLLGSAGLYVLYDRWQVRRAAERANYAAKWRTPDATARPRSPVVFLIVVFAGGGSFFFGARYLQRRADARHPAADEHRAELLEAAAARLSCGRDALMVQRDDDPRHARVAGCGKSVTFRWGARLLRARPRTYSAQQWYEIDPSCRVDYMGCAMPCE